MKILIIEPFFTGSHERWAVEYKARSSHEVTILSLEGRAWKWRMRGGAVTLARLFREGGYSPDLILATDMLDLATFLSLTRELTAKIPVAVYFHENQLGYPWSPNERDSAGSRRHYGFINFTTALSADRVLFNSKYHMDSFLGDLDPFLGAFPDHNEVLSIERIRDKSRLLYLGMDFERFDSAISKESAPPSDEKSPPLILWNHRWEYDKGPEEFFQALNILMRGGLAFEVAILGEHFEKIPKLFDEAKEVLGERVVHFGYATDYAEYVRWLNRADIVPVTSTHDFFGSSVIEAIYGGAIPILPKRLAYPEHIPKGFHGSCFYEGFDDLVNKVEGAINKVALGVEKGEGRFSNGALREHVSRYGWQEMAPLYDEMMDRVKADVVDS
jgi:glycosyltransferase involved in cell wall biosynthesis